MRKERMGKLELENGDVLTCSRGTQWPPIDAIIYGGSEQARPFISEQTYNSIRVWEQACGIRPMKIEKCPTCPYVKLNGELVVKPGSSGLKPQATKATRVVSNRAQRAKQVPGKR